MVVEPASADEVCLCQCVHAKNDRFQAIVTEVVLISEFFIIAAAVSIVSSCIEIQLSRELMNEMQLVVVLVVVVYLTGISIVIVSSTRSQ